MIRFSPVLVSSVRLPRQHRQAKVTCLLAAIVIGTQLTLLGGLAIGADPDRSYPSLEPQPPYLTLRILPGVSDETLEHLAKICEPTQVDARKGESIVEAFRRFYGFHDYKTVSWRLFRGYNPTVEKEELDSDTSLSMPAGPHWQFGVKKRIPAGKTLREILNYYMGEPSIGRKTQIDFFKRNPSLNLQIDQVVARAQDAVLPYSTRPYTYKLRPEYAGNLTEGQQSFVNDPIEDDRRVLQIGPTDTPRLVRSFSLADIAKATNDGSVDPGWVQKALSFPFKDQLRSSPVVVAIVDSGIAVNIPELKQNLWRNTDPNKDCKDDHTVGCNCLTLSGFPEDDLDDVSPHQHHGTHVAGIAAGWPVREQLAASLRDPQANIELMILKVVDQQGQVDPSAIVEALYYAAQHKAAVVNLSLLGKKKNFYDWLMGRLFVDQVFVVAAGNGIQESASHVGINLDVAGDEDPVYPAVLTRNYNNIITVGAHDDSGEKSSFSNFGRETVDLLAPGNAIESIIGDGNLLTRSGTSQAAPFVTLTAAMLLSQGDYRPYQIKQRILASVDYDPKLRETARTSGRLNIAKAMSIHKDLIETRSHEFIRGKVGCFTPVKLQETLPIGLSQKRGIRRVAFQYADEQQNTQLVFIGSHESQLDIKPARLEIKTLVIERDDGAKLKVRAHEILDFLPRMPGPDVPECGKHLEFSANPLITNASLSNPPNEAGWNRTDVTLTLKVDDGFASGTSVQKISYTMNEGTREVSSDSTEFPIGEGITNISYFSVDRDGYREYPERLITVKVDKTLPSLSLPSDMRAEATGPDGVSLDYIATATDNLDPNPTIACSIPSGSPLPIGETRVVCRARDAAGNLSEGSFRVTVVDSLAPVIAVPAEIKVAASSPDGAIVSFDVRASDAADAHPKLECDKTGDAFPIGTSTVSCNATDASGNKSAASFQVTVLGSVDQLTELVSLVRETGLARDPEERLLDRLQRIRGSLTNPDSACKRIDDALKSVNGQKEAALLPDKVREDLSQRLERLRLVLGGCN